MAYRFSASAVELYCGKNTKMQFGVHPKILGPPFDLIIGPFWWPINSQMKIWLKVQQPPLPFGVSQNQGNNCVKVYMVNFTRSSVFSEAASKVWNDKNLGVATLAPAATCWEPGLTGRPVFDSPWFNLNMLWDNDTLHPQKSVKDDPMTRCKKQVEQFGTLKVCWGHSES